MSLIVMRLTKELVDIPLEYFADAIAFLKAETGHEKVGLRVLPVVARPCC